MNLSMTFRNVITTREKMDKMAQTVRAKLERLTTRADDIQLSITDVNGDKGGVDKLATLIFTGTGRRHLVLKAMARTEIEAVRNVLRKLKSKLIAPKNKAHKKRGEVRELFTQQLAS